MLAAWYERQRPAGEVLHVGELLFGAQTYRPFGTAARLTVVPEHQPDPLTARAQEEP